MKKVFLKYLSAICVMSVTGYIGIQFAHSAVVNPAAPVIIAPAHNTFANGSKPIITGIAQENVRIAVYIDNVFNGYAQQVSEREGTQSFAYTPFLDLRPGQHTVFARAENTGEGTRSAVSAQHVFTIEPAYPAPTVIGTVQNGEEWQKPFIVGVAPSEALIEIWIDDVLNGLTHASVDASGSGNFSYTPFLPLSSGTHTVQAVAIGHASDGSKKRSTQSESKTVRIVQSDSSSSSTTSATQSDTHIHAADAHSEIELVQTNESESQSPTQDTEESAESQIPFEQTETDEQKADAAPPISSEATNQAEITTEEAAQPETQKNKGISNVIGWVLLIAASIIAVSQIQERRKKEQASQQSQLDPQAGKQQSHVELVHSEPSTEEKESAEKAKTEPKEGA